MILEGRFSHPDTVYTEATTSLFEYKRCNTKEQGYQPEASRGSRERIKSWIPPPVGTIKVN
jgi:hypothetical protein